eukprot:SAG22_NODE_1479_length_4327_cov_1.368496_4_plen_166_part_00
MAMFAPTAASPPQQLLHAAALAPCSVPQSVTSSLPRHGVVVPGAGEMGGAADDDDVAPAIGDDANAGGGQPATSRPACPASDPALHASHSGPIRPATSAACAGATSAAPANATLRSSGETLGRQPAGAAAEAEGSHVAAGRGSGGRHPARRRRGEATVMLFFKRQ